MRRRLAGLIIGIVFLVITSGCAVVSDPPAPALPGCSTDCGLKDHPDPNGGPPILDGGAEHPVTTTTTAPPPDVTVYPGYYCPMSHMVNVGCIA